MSKLPTAQPEQLSTDVRLIDSSHTEGRVGISRWSLWRWEREGRFPRSIKVGSKRLWVESEVSDWIAARMAEREPTS